MSMCNQIMFLQVLYYLSPVMRGMYLARISERGVPTVFINACLSLLLLQQRTYFEPNPGALMRNRSSDLFINIMFKTCQS